MIDMSRRLGLGLCAVAIVTLMSACGGGSSEATSTPPIVSSAPPIEEIPDEVVSGIATPSSVSVVTATNSN